MPYLIPKPIPSTSNYDDSAFYSVDDEAGETIAGADKTVDVVLTSRLAFNSVF